MPGATRELLIKITGANADALKKLDTTARKVNAVGRRIGRTARNVVSMTAKIGAGVAALGTGAFLAGRKILKVGARVEETANKFRTVFGPATREASAFLEDFARKAGLTVQEGEELMATTGAIAQGFGMDQAASASFSKQILKTAGDLASFNNIPIQETTRAIQAALAGEREQLKRLGIVIRQEDVNHQALADTGKKAAKALTQEEEAAATLQLIMEKAGVAIGDLNRTQDSTANRARRVARDFRQLADDVSVALLPALSDALAFLDENRGALIRFVRTTLSGAVQMISSFVRTAVRLHAVVANTFLGDLFGMDEGKAEALAEADERLEKLKQLRGEAPDLGMGNLRARAASLLQTGTRGMGREKIMAFLGAEIDQLQQKIDSKGGLTDSFNAWQQEMQQTLEFWKKLEQQVTEGLGRIGTGLGTATGEDQGGTGDVQVQPHGELMAKTVGLSLAQAATSDTSQVQGKVTQSMKDPLGGAIANVGNWVKGQAKSIGQSLIMGIMTGSGDMGQTLKRFMASLASKFIMSAIAGPLGIASPSKVMRRMVGRPIVDGIIRGMKDRLPALARAVEDVHRAARGGVAAGVTMPAGGPPRLASAAEVPLRARLEGLPSPDSFSPLSHAAIATDPSMQRLFRTVFDVAADQGFEPGSKS